MESVYSAVRIGSLNEAVCDPSFNNPALEDVEKFHYFLSAVTNGAHQLIENLPVTQQNVHVTCNLLRDRYINERLIAAAHMMTLVNFYCYVFLIF
jgi:hypothetical protein